MKKLLLSLMMVGVVGGGVAAATYAYFTSSQSVLGNTISTGTMAFDGLITDTSGDSTGDHGKFSLAGLLPGDTFTRCLWVKNSGTVAGRYKIYASSESGDTSLGDLLTITTELNPTTGYCSGITQSFVNGLTKYGPDNSTKTAWTNVPVRGAFMSDSPTTGTPFKILSGEPAMQGGYYSLIRVTIALNSSATQQGASYVQNIALFGMQDAGSSSSF